MECNEIVEETTNVLVKSEKIPQKKKKRIVLGFSTLLLIITLTFLIIDYSDYKSGQEFGLASSIMASDIAGLHWVDLSDPYAKQCKDMYNQLNKHTYDMTIGGVTIDASGVRKAESNMRSALANLMTSAGFDRYSSYNIADWFKYTNIVEYFAGCYWNSAPSICCGIVLLTAMVFTVLINREEEKELIIYEDYVLCKTNSQESKQLFFESITNVGIENGTLKITVPGFEFKISNLTNAENIKDVIIEKRNLCRANLKV